MNAKAQQHNPVGLRQNIRLSPGLRGHGNPGGSWSTALESALKSLLFKQRENRDLKLFFCLFVFVKFLGLSEARVINFLVILQVQV